MSTFKGKFERTKPKVSIVSTGASARRAFAQLVVTELAVIAAHTAGDQLTMRFQSAVRDAFDEARIMLKPTSRRRNPLPKAPKVLGPKITR